MRNAIDSSETVGHVERMSGPAAEPERAAPLFACVLVTPYGIPAPKRLELAEALRAHCARITDRVAWSYQRGQDWPDAALLALGPCAASEAQAVCERLLAWLAARRLTTARMGIGPSQTLAQLAAQRGAPGVVRVVEPEQARAFLQRLPVEALSGLAAAEITAELIARLQRFGLRTLGQVAQLDARDPQALRRQFGAAAGARLGALAQGVDLCPLQATPAPERLTLGLRFASGASPDQALAALPRLMARLAERLAASGTGGKCGQMLRLRVAWESGGVMRARRRLARPLHQPSELTQVAQALLTTLLARATATEASAEVDAGAGAALVIALTVTLGDLTPRPPAWQTALIPTTRPHLAGSEETAGAPGPLERIAREVAEPLARRYGGPALYRLTTPQPDAILPEERARLVGLSAERLGQQPDDAGKQRLSRGRSATEALGVDGLDAPGARPPQPHWW